MTKAELIQENRELIDKIYNLNRVIEDMRKLRALAEEKNELAVLLLKTTLGVE